MEVGELGIDEVQSVEWMRRHPKADGRGHRSLRGILLHEPAATRG